MVVHDLYTEYFTTRLGTFRESGDYSDIKIVVDGEEFACHKVVLSAASLYFHAMFSSGMTESRQEKITITHDGLSAAMFRNVLNYLYKGEDIVTKENAPSLFSIAFFFQVDVLQLLCEKVMIQSLTAENCISIWKLAELHSCTSVSEAARTFLLEHFVEVVDSKAYLGLDIELLTTLLQDNGLVAPSEEFVCNAALQWLVDDTEGSNRKGHANNLLKFLRLPLVTPEYLLNIYERFPSLDQQIAHEFVEEARMYHMMPARRHDVSSTRTENRTCSGFMDVLLVIGGINSYPRRNNFRCVYCVAFDEQMTWYKLPSAPHMTGGTCASCTHDRHSLYVSDMNKKILQTYNGQLNKWTICKAPTELQHVPYAQSNQHEQNIYSCVAVGSSIYSFCECGHIVTYNIPTDNWSANEGTLLEDSKNPHAVASGDKILILAEVKPSSGLQGSIQCYDTCRKTTTVVSRTTSPEWYSTKGLQSVSVGLLDSVIYIFNEMGGVIQFTADGKVTKMFKMNERKEFQVIQYRGLPLVVGGGRYVAEKLRLATNPTFLLCGNKNTVMKVDWKMMPCSGICSARIVVKKEHLNTLA